MPKSRRDKTVHLSKVKKDPKARKERFLQKVRDSADIYKSIYVLTFRNMRSNHYKNLQQLLGNSKFFYGKNKVMQIALGKDEMSEHNKNLSKISDLLKGQVGLLFTNEERDKVLDILKNFVEYDFPIAGFVPKEDVIIEKGPLKQFSHSMESYLRSLGLPTQLKNSVVDLAMDYTLCTKGQKLSVEQAKLTKHFGHKLADFRVVPIAVWTSPESFEKLEIPSEFQINNESEDENENENNNDDDSDGN
eukprot:TRINITY_DN16651_c0_g1_i1.p1 TRINITY_DN16651_c0_g1~~TRINITY_DN16651_c0_g1_i1.p1  ORF type:complete len:247 (-),score=80.36 TRINITY_DN16651_c0_g1_i1:42-782(-)